MQYVKWIHYLSVGILTLLGVVACGEKDKVITTSPSVAELNKPLKVAFVYVGPVGDGGWTFAHDQGRKALQDALGDRVETSYIEKVREGADSERVFRELVSLGNTLIFGTSFGYSNAMLRVAKNNKDVKFEHTSGYQTAENMRTYYGRSYEPVYMAGTIAGSMTKTNVIGVIGSVPIPEIIRNINSFTLGARSVNPEVTTKVVWVGEWFNPGKEAEAATALINNGADILIQNTDSPAVLQTAQKMGKRAFGWDSDMEAYGPKAHLASVVYDWAPYYIQSATQVLDNTWVGDKDTRWGMKEGMVDIVSLADDIPKDVRARLQKLRSGFMDESLKVWKGPLKDNKGREVLAEGVVADAEFIRNMNFYVEGVEGEVPNQ